MILIMKLSRVAQTSPEIAETRLELKLCRLLQDMNCESDPWVCCRVDSMFVAITRNRDHRYLDRPKAVQDGDVTQQ